MTSGVELPRRAATRRAISATSCSMCGSWLNIRALVYTALSEAVKPKKHALRQSVRVMTLRVAFARTGLVLSGQKPEGTWRLRQVV